MEITQDDGYVLIDCNIYKNDNTQCQSQSTQKTSPMGIKRIYDTDREFTMLFDIKDYLISIWESYDKNSMKVWKQFCLDFPRMDFMFDEENITDPHQFFHQIYHHRN